MAKKQRFKKTTNAAVVDAEIYDSQEKLDYLRGPSGERDRRTIWKAAQGTLPGTGEGGFVEGWLDRD